MADEKNLPVNDDEMVVIDNEGNEHVCEIYFTYESERTGKNFVFFTEKDTDDEVIVMEETNEGELNDVEDEEDLKEVQEVFDTYQADMEEDE